MGRLTVALTCARPNKNAIIGVRPQSDDSIAKLFFVVDWRKTLCDAAFAFQAVSWNQTKSRRKSLTVVTNLFHVRDLRCWIPSWYPVRTPLICSGFAHSKSKWLAPIATILNSDTGPGVPSLVSTIMMLDGSPQYLVLMTHTQMRRRASPGKLDSVTLTWFGGAFSRPSLLSLRISWGWERCSASGGGGGRNSAPSEVYHVFRNP